MEASTVKKRDEEPAKYTKHDKRYLKSIRNKPWPQSHPNLLYIREEEKEQGLLPTTSSIYGHTYFVSVSKKGVDYARANYVTQANDVFITSFPRSGTHWLMKICMEIMRNCAYNFNDLPPEYQNADYRYIPQFEPMISKKNGVNILNDWVNRYNVQYPSLRFNFSHCPWRLFPAKKIHPKTKIIHIVRDIKDTTVSMRNFIVDINRNFHPNKEFIENMEQSQIMSIEQCAQDILFGQTLGGNWWDSLVEWYLASKNCENNILFLYYEDIIENPSGMIQKIANFLGKDEGEKYLDYNKINDVQIINKIVKKTAFSAHKKTAKRGWEFVFRKGCVGDWKNHFNGTLQKQMDNMSRVTFYGMNDIRYNKDKGKNIRAML